jgi:hypothetical protein
MRCVAAQPTWSPDRQIIDELERTVTLPAGAKLLKQYSRYYAGTVRNGVRVVVATYISGLDVSRIVGSEAALPGVLDGGCDIVNVEYDVKRHRFVQVFCNGVA